SKRLYEQDAETKEKMSTDYSNWQQQELTLKGLQQKQQAQQASAYEQQLEIQKAQNTRSDFQIIAASSGVITDLVAKVGQSVQVAMELGKIIDVEQPMVEAEVDELFVNDVKVGQSVLIFPVGRKDQAANGRISYLSPILSEKSILYETANEGQDRRVRKIKIEIEGNNVLTINSKVDCTIKIRWILKLAFKFIRYDRAKSVGIIIAIVISIFLIGQQLGLLFFLMGLMGNLVGNAPVQDNEMWIIEAQSNNINSVNSIDQRLVQQIG